MQQIKKLSCSTVYGRLEEYSTFVDYLKISGLEDVSIGEKGHNNYENIKSLKSLKVSMKMVCIATQIRCSTQMISLNTVISLNNTTMKSQNK